MQHDLIQLTKITAISSAARGIRTDAMCRGSHSAGSDTSEQDHEESRRRRGRREPAGEGGVEDRHMRYVELARAASMPETAPGLCSGARGIRSLISSSTSSSIMVGSEKSGPP